ERPRTSGRWRTRTPPATSPFASRQEWSARAVRYGLTFGSAASSTGRPPSALGSGDGTQLTTQHLAARGLRHLVDDRDAAGVLVRRHPLLAELDQVGRLRGGAA